MVLQICFLHRSNYFISLLLRCSSDFLISFLWNNFVGIKLDPETSTLSDYILKCVLELINKDVTDSSKYLVQYFQLFVMYVGFGVPEVKPFFIKFLAKRKGSSKHYNNHFWLNISWTFLNLLLLIKCFLNV